MNSNDSSQSSFTTSQFTGTQDFLSQDLGHQGRASLPREPVRSIRAGCPIRATAQMGTDCALQQAKIEL
ncbi:MAG TPA: hypothetical protein VK699_03695 [Terriglobales bacterium]|jgi:hypothetical protein|nr:hypothetical protein [Terriglobales bacterium]